MSSQKWTISFVEQGKLKVGVPSWQTRLFSTKNMEGGSLAMSAVANTTL
jgi:hypothetical protein